MKIQIDIWSKILRLKKSLLRKLNSKYWKLMQRSMLRQLKYKYVTISKRFIAIISVIAQSSMK
jgi:hypothetical protein